MSDALLSLDGLQWPAMAATVLAAWLVASQKKTRRHAGFWVYLASNVLWSAWGLHDHAYALVALQIVLAAMNVRGMKKNDPAPDQPGRLPETKRPAG